MQDHLFAKLPIALIKCGLLCELKSTTVVIYNVLLSYADFNTGKCFPSIKTIHKLTGYSKTTIIQGIKELEDWGLIEVTRRQGSHNVYQLQYWWGRKATGTKTWTGGVQNLDRGGSNFSTLTTTNNKNHINRATVVNRSRSSKESGSSQAGLSPQMTIAEKEAKKLVYQLRIAEMQQQQSWTKAIQEQFRRLFNKELPAEIIDEKFAQGIKAQFLLEILKNIYDPSKIRNPIGWFRSISEDWGF